MGFEFFDVCQMHMTKALLHTAKATSCAAHSKEHMASCAGKALLCATSDT